MKLHLPVSLFRSLLTCMAMVCGTTLATVSAATTYPNGSKTYTTRQTSALTLEGYESIWFKDIFYFYDDAKGGAIYNYRGTFTLSNNGDVTFSGNTASSSHASYASSYGGAIYNYYYATFTLSGNGDVTFSGNTASSTTYANTSYAYAYGGAIYNSGDNATFTLSGNGDVTFSGNTASASSSDSSDSSGGAIFNSGDNATFTLSGNGDVTFSGNTASSSGSICSSSPYAHDSSGGAVYNSGNNATFTLSDNGNVTFSGNTASSYYSSYGGAIYNSRYGTFTLSDNGDVTFSGNTASSGSISSSSPYYSSYGGAIYNSRYGTFTLSDNGDVTFSGNTVSSDCPAYGGAICNDGDNATFTLSNNGDVTFSGNTASASGYYYYNSDGGAIYNSRHGTFTLSDNGAVTFSGNTASSSDDAYAYGGAIYNSGTFALSGNGDVTFSGNTASASDDAYAYGGAINNNAGTFTLSGNGNVTFSGNTASASSYGGAINNSWNSTFTLSGNGDVLFKKNCEITNGTYRLRSIYSTGELNLSASAGKSILFKDSVYASGTVKLNQDGTGDIIFTGATTESDLRGLKGGVAGTASEIRNSRSSVLAAAVTLGGGTLQVQDGASLTVTNLTAADGSSLVLKDAAFTMSKTSVLSDVSISGNATLSVASGAELTVRGAITSGSQGGTLILQGNGKTVFLFGNTYNGGTILREGTLVADNLKALGTGAVKLAGGKLVLDNLNGSFGNALTGTGSLTVNNGSNVLTLTGASTYSGGTTLNGGTLVAGNVSAFGTGAVKLAGGKLVLDNLNGSFGNALTGTGSLTVNNGSNVLSLTGASTYSSGTTLNGGTLVITNLKALGTGAVKLNGGELVLSNLSGSFGNALTGTGSLTVNNGSNVLTLTGASTYSGGTTLNGGTLVVANLKALGTGEVKLAGGKLVLDNLNGSFGNDLTGMGSLTVNNGSNVLTLTGISTYSGGTTLNGGTLVADNLKALGTGAVKLAGGKLVLDNLNGSFGNALTGTGSLTVNNGSNVLTLTGASTYSGGTTLRNGTLVVNNLKALGTGAVKLAGGKLVLDNLNGCFGNALTGTGSLTVNNGSNILTLNEISSYSGGTQVQGGTLAAGNVSAFGTGAVTLAGGTLNLNNKAVANTVKVTGSARMTNGGAYAGSLVLAGGTLSGGPVRLLRTATLQSGTVNAALTGTGAVQKTSADTVTMNAAASYSGGTLLNEGTLVVKNLKALGTGTVSLNGGTLNLNSLNGTFANNIAGTGGLTINTVNTLTLSGSNSYTGGTVLQAGCLVAGKGGAFGRGAVQIADGTLDLNGLAVNNTLQVTGEAQLANAERYTGQLVMDGGTLRGTKIQLVKNAELRSGTLYNNMSGKGGVEKNGYGTAKLAGMNTYTGTTVINDGTLTVSGLVTGDILLNENGTLNTWNGMTLNVNQTLTMAGGKIAGSLTTDADTYLTVQRGTEISGYLELGGGCVTLNNKGLDNVLSIGGTLYLTNKTQLKLVGYDTAGAYVLARYGGLYGSLSNLDVTLAFPEGSRQKAAVRNSSGYLVLTITGDAAVLNWNAAEGEWKTLGSTKWAADSTVSDKRFHASDIAVFNRGGTATISGRVEPMEVRVGGSAAVVFKGTGSIIGAGTLTKEGTSALALNASNAYTGGTVIRGGSVKAGGAGSFGANRIWLQKGTLNLNAKAVANDITASGGTISGGSAYAGELTVEGAVSVSGTLTADSINLIGGSLSGGTLTDTAVYATKGSLSGTFAGNSTFAGNRYALKTALKNTGTLTLSGIIDASALTETVDSATYVDVNGATGTSGFALRNGYAVRLVSGGKTVNGGCSILYNGGELLLKSDGTAVNAGALDYNTYYVKKGTTLSTSRIHLAGPGAAVSMNGGTLTVDDAAAVKATGGTIMLSGGEIVSGSIANTAVTSAGGTIRASLSGTSTLTATGNTQVTGGLTLAALTLKGGNLNAKVATGAVTRMSLSGNNTIQGSLTLNGGEVVFGTTPLKVDGTLSLAGSTDLDVTAYKQNGTFTLIQADSVSGTTETLLCHGDAWYQYALSTRDGALNLKVTPRFHEYTWTASSGTWKTGGKFANGTFAAGDHVSFLTPATVTISGTVAPNVLTVGNTSGTVTFKAANTSSRIAGAVKLTKNGAGALTLNNGNTYTGGTVINAGTVNAGGATAFGTGGIALKGGTLNLGSHAIANAIKVAGASNIKGTAYKGALTIAANMGAGTNLSIAKTATLAKGKVNGVLTGAAGVKVTGEATLAGKNTYKGTTAVAAGALLHLTGTVAGNYSVAGTLDASQKAITLGSGKAMTVADGGVVTGKVTVNSGATLTVKGTKSKLGTTVITGGTAVLNSKAAAVQATGSGVATVYGKKLTLGTTKSTLKMADKEAVNLNSGKLTINAVSSTYTGNLVAKGGTLDLASRAVKNNVVLGNAVLAHASGLTGTLYVQNANARYRGSLTLTSNNKLNFTAGSKLTVTGTLTLKGGTALTLGGSGWKAGSYTLMSAGTLSGKAATAFKVASLSGFTSAITSSGKNVVLTLRKAATKAAAPDLTADAEPALAAEPSLAAEPMAEPTVTSPAVSADAKAAQSMADALVQADWAVLDATRAFTSGIRNRSTGTLTPDGKGAVWMNAIGSLARHSSVNGHSGSQVNLYGGAVGAEHHIGEHHSIGAAVGGTHANIDNTPMGKLRQDTTHVALYGNSRMGSKFSADWAAAFGSTNAHGNVGAVRAKWQQNSTELTARLTYAEMLNDNTQLRTFAGLDYDATNADRTNGGKTGSVQALRGEFGLGLTHATETYSLYGEVGMVGDMVRHNPVAETDGFRLKGANPGRIGLKATLGGSIRLNDTWSANASYNLETAADATMQSVNVGASRKF